MRSCSYKRIYKQHQQTEGFAEAAPAQVPRLGFSNGPQAIDGTIHLDYTVQYLSFQTVCSMCLACFAVKHYYDYSPNVEIMRGLTRKDTLKVLNSILRHSMRHIPSSIKPNPILERSSLQALHKLEADVPLADAAAGRKG